VFPVDFEVAVLQDDQIQTLTLCLQVTC